MKLVKFENYKLTVSEEALFVKSFAFIWNRDKTKDKIKALSEFGYLYFQYDPRSDYMFITNEEERTAVIKEQEGLPATWKPDKYLLEAAKDYVYLTQTTGALLLQDTRLAIDKVRKFLTDVDLTKTDDKGKPVYTINSITSTIKDLPKLVRDLTEAEKDISKEIAENTKMRGQKVKKIMEDGFAKRR